jgi:hypothetical protein
MPLIKTYSPESVKLTVADVVIEGYDEGTKNFIEGSEDFFTIHLHFGSESIGKLRKMKHPTQCPIVKFESGITSCAYVEGEYLTSQTAHTYLDFIGKYSIDGPNFSYGLDGVKVSFNFQKI